jgi:hypothetical protein
VHRQRLNFDVLVDSPSGSVSAGCGVCRRLGTVTRRVFGKGRWSAKAWRGSGKGSVPVVRSTCESPHPRASPRAAAHPRPSGRQGLRQRPQSGM